MSLLCARDDVDGAVQTMIVCLHDLLAVANDGDGLRRAALRGEDDLVLGSAFGVGDDRDAVLVEVEDPRRPERAVPRAHADLSVDLDLEHPPTLPGGPQTDRANEIERLRTRLRGTARSGRRPGRSTPDRD